MVALLIPMIVLPPAATHGWGARARSTDRRRCGRLGGRGLR